MGEIQGVSNHHVKVDNWPLFFLQRLYHFYRKKTHCDLTLLVPSLDSVKIIKVHKLVLHACTDYFDSLDIKEDSEHGEVMELSNEMHPDVIIPIISFMYTGKLEFPVNLQPKLYEAATKLRMTILTKLLDVQPGKGGKTYIKKETGIQEISTVEISQRSSDSSSPILVDDAPRIAVKSVSAIQQKPVSDSPGGNASVVTPTIRPKLVRKASSSPISAIAKSKTFENSLPPTLPGRKLPVWTRKIPSSPLLENTQNMKDYVEIPPRPTRFEWDEDLTDPTIIRPVEEATKVLSHDQPIRISQPIILENTTLESRESDESLRRSFSDGSSSESPPYKRFKSDLQEMKEYGKQQQLRNEIICSEENLDDIMDADDLYGPCEDDDLDDADDSPNFSPFNANSSTPKPILKTMSKSDPQMSSKRVRFSLEGKENNQQENTSSGGDFTVLKEPESDGTGQKIVVPVSQIQDGKQHVKIVSEVLKKYPNLAKKDNIKLRVVSKNPGVPSTVHRAAEGEAGTGSKASSSLVSYIFLTNKSSGDLVKTKPPDAISKEKLFDVENVTGPWFCRVCNTSRPIQFDSYYNYRRHLVQVHELRIDARICEYCGLRNSKRNLLLYHMYTKHGVDPPPNISFPKCGECNYIALSDALLAKHKSTHDPLELTCYTCNVAFKSYSSIQMHMKSIWHKNKLNKGALSDYPCPFCNIRFENGSELKEHIESSHHSQMAAAKLKKQMYRCPYCEGIYDDGDKLGKHIVSEHWGKKTQVSNQETKAETNAEQSGQQLEITAGAEEEPSEIESVEMQPSSESESLNNVASGIATSLSLQSDQAVVFYEHRSEDQELDRQTTMVAEGECKEFIVINPIEVDAEGRPNQEMEAQVQTINIINEDSNSRLSNLEANESSCPEHEYSECQTEDSNSQEVISVQEVDDSASSVIQKLLPDQGLVFANESDVVFESSCVGLPQRVILTSGNIVLPEGSSSQQGVILSQVLPQTRIILTSPGILQQSGSIIEKGSTLVFASSENGEAMEGIEEAVEFTAQNSEVSRVEDLEKQEEEETLIVLASCEPGTENPEMISEKNDEEHVEAVKKTIEESEKVVDEEVEGTKEVNQSVIKPIGEKSETTENVEEGKTSETNETMIIIVDDDSASQPPSERIQFVEGKEGKKDNEETTENTSDGKKEEETLVKKSAETKTSENKKKEETKPIEKKQEEETKIRKKERKEETRILEKKKEEEKRIPERKKEEERRTSEKKKEGEKRTPEKKKEEEKRTAEKKREEGTRISEKEREEDARIPEKKTEEETKIAEKEKEEEEEEEETRIAEKKEEKETKMPEKKKEEERRMASHRVETSQIVEDWDESNDSQPKIESRSDGPSRPDFF